MHTFVHLYSHTSTIVFTSTLLRPWLRVQWNYSAPALYIAINRPRVNSVKVVWRRNTPSALLACIVWRALWKHFYERQHNWRVFPTRTVCPSDVCPSLWLSIIVSQNGCIISSIIFTAWQAHQFFWAETELQNFDDSDASTLKWSVNSMRKIKTRKNIMLIQMKCMTQNVKRNKTQSF